MTRIGQCQSLAVVLAALCLSALADDPSSHSVQSPGSKDKQPTIYTLCSRLILRTHVSDTQGNSNEQPRSQATLYQQHFMCPVIHHEIKCCGLSGNQRCCSEEDFTEPRHQRLTAGLFTAGALVFLAMLCFAGPAVCCLRCRCPRSRRGGSRGVRSGTLPDTSPPVIFRPGDTGAETGQVDLHTDRRPLRSVVTWDGSAPHADYGAAAKTSPTTTTVTTFEDETSTPQQPLQQPLQQSPNSHSNLPPPPYPGL